MFAHSEKVKVGKKSTLLGVPTPVPRGLGRSSHAMRMARWDKVPFTLWTNHRAFQVIAAFIIFLPQNFFFFNSFSFEIDTTIGVGALPAFYFMDKLGEKCRTISPRAEYIYRVFLPSPFETRHIPSSSSLVYLLFAPLLHLRRSVTISNPRKEKIGENLAREKKGQTERERGKKKRKNPKAELNPTNGPSSHIRE
ncbi:hypothetical protein BDV23DRAFT_23512 [Aspergillus alliaceus]|uniref:Uncharacterized protein n=1 Tax=Petromyces alliaceus TaxID=209559 RepID=A0A5N7CK15_PETAA|nr:hypothetical protein BDV23DRAFT_23512 [Aspergillus alliaceus]